MDSHGLWEEAQAEHIVNSLLVEHFAKESNLSVPYMISITGIPGSGKTTSAKQLEEAIKQKINTSYALSDLGIQVVSLQMDGFHYYRSTLDAFESVKVESDEYDPSIPEKMRTCQAHYPQQALFA